MEDASAPLVPPESTFCLSDFLSILVSVFGCAFLWFGVLYAANWKRLRDRRAAEARAAEEAEQLRRNPRVFTPEE